MKDDDRNGIDSPGDDPGEPILLLEQLELAPRADFLGRVRRRIERRAVTVQFADLSWSAPKEILLEFVRMVFEFFAPSDNGGSR